LELNGRETESGQGKKIAFITYRKKTFFQGEKHVFRGPVVLSEAPGLVSGDNPDDPDGFRSIMCDCDMVYINCVPTDNFEVVLYCDASSATVTQFLSQGSMQQFLEYFSPQNGFFT
jgi:hypothetical protein